VSLLEVIRYPNPLLKQPAVNVAHFDDDLNSLASNMFETMAFHKGVGLAGPQVSVMERILVAGFEGEQLVLVNPEIISKKGKTLDEEGCLSIPDILVEIERADQIVVEGYDIKGNGIKVETSGFFSRILQHEIDHLNGILILDHGEPLLASDREVD